MADNQPFIPADIRLEDVANRVLDSGYISRQEYLELTTLFLNDETISDREKYLMNQIFDDVRANRISFTN